MKFIKSVVIIIVILVVSLVVYGIMSKNNIGSLGTPGSNSEKTRNEFVNYYTDEVRRFVFQKMNNNESPFCFGNCKDIYQISSNDIDFEVVDNGDEMVKVIFKATENGKYRSINLSDSDCSRVLDTTCNGTVLENYISKKWME